MVDFPRPQNQGDLQSFSFFSVFYRPFIKDYDSISEPLVTLLKKDVLFNWNTEIEDSFLQLKALLAKNPVLAEKQREREETYIQCNVVDVQKLEATIDNMYILGKDQYNCTTS